MDIKILVASHKRYWMPSDPIYFPLHVGAEGKKDADGNELDLGYVKDNTGDNISAKNKNFCELTGIYWAWKNLDADYVGLAHYRRHFVSKRFGAKENRILDKTNAEKLLSANDILLPTPRNYYIETNYDQYVHAHHATDLNTTRQILCEKYGEYLKAYDDSMRRTVGHRFNMFIMKKEYFDKYCVWLFDVLFELERRLDISEYSDYDARVFGFVSERLLDVWLETNGLAYREIPYVFMEKQNWIIKGTNFIARKVKAGNLK